MLWKIYFWISVIIASLNVINLLIRIVTGEAMGILSIIPTLVYALAVYAYIYKKHILPRRSWKIWLFLVLMMHIIRWSALWPLDSITWEPITIGIILFGSLVFPLPAWYCIYKLGFDNEQVKLATKKTMKKQK